MRRYALMAIILLLCAHGVSALSVKEDASQVPVVNLDSGTIRYDFGSVTKDSIVTKTVAIKNKLDRILYVKEARSSCECIEVHLLPQRLKRNESVDLVITLDTHGLSAETENAIYILTDDMEYEVIALQVKAHPIKDE